MQVKDVVKDMYKIKEIIETGNTPPPTRIAEPIIEPLEITLEPVNLKLEPVNLELEPINLADTLEPVNLTTEAKAYTKELTKLNKFLDHNPELLKLEYKKLLTTEKPTSKEKQLIKLLSNVKYAHYKYDIKDTPLKNI